jgi:hypothetical protein
MYAEKRGSIMKSCTVAMALLCCVPVSAAADLILNVDSATVSYSATQTQTGWLEVYVQSDANPQPFLIGEQVRLHILPASAGVTFTAYEKTTTHPYIFPAGQLWAGSLSDGGATATVGDGLLLGSDQLANGDGLARVQYQVAPGTAVGAFNVSVDTGISFIKQDNGVAGVALPYTVHAGSINITPEPGTLVLLLMAGLAAGYWRWSCRAKR